MISVLCEIDKHLVQDVRTSRGMTVYDCGKLCDIAYLLVVIMEAVKISTQYKLQAFPKFVERRVDKMSESTDEINLSFAISQNGW